MNLVRCICHLATFLVAHQTSSQELNLDETTPFQDFWNKETENGTLRAVLTLSYPGDLDPSTPLPSPWQLELTDDDIKDALIDKIPDVVDIEVENLPSHIERGVALDVRVSIILNKTANNYVATNLTEAVLKIATFGLYITPDFSFLKISVNGKQVSSTSDRCFVHDIIETCPHGQSCRLTDRQALCSTEHFLTYNKKASNEEGSMPWSLHLIGVIIVITAIGSTVAAVYAISVTLRFTRQFMNSSSRENITESAISLRILSREQMQQQDYFRTMYEAENPL